MWCDFDNQREGDLPGKGSGPLLVSPVPISFLSGVDPESGIIVETGHPLRGECVLHKSVLNPSV